MLTIRKADDDDPEYLTLVRSILIGCLHQYQPSEVYIVRIRDCFDYKWCYFSGKAIREMGFSDFRGLTLPPFVPNRVLSQDHYVLEATSGDDYEPSEAPPLHVYQSSASNMKRFVRRIMPNGAMIWFSSGSKSTGRGSVMVYSVFSSNLKFGWHITLLKKSEWQIDKVTFTSRSLVEGLRRIGSRVIAAADEVAGPTAL